MDLRQSTAGQVVTIGHALDSTNGNDEENALTIANTDIKLHKHNTTVLANKNSGGATSISNGVYHLTFDATDSSAAGRLVAYVHVAGALAMKIEFNVLTQSAFDALYTGTFNNLGGTAQTADHTAAIADIPTTAEFELRTVTSATYATSAALADVPTVSELNARTLLANDYFDPSLDQVVVATNNDKTGYVLTQTFPANFNAMVISATGDVNSDLNKINGVTIIGDGSANPFDV